MNHFTQLSPTDKKIIAYLQAQAKITNLKISQKIGLSPAATLERVKKLENRGIIKSYHARLDPKKLGLHICMLVQVKLKCLTAASVTAFTEAIAHIPEVVICHQTVGGDADFLAQVIAADMPAYQHVVMHQLSAIKEIQCIKASIITDTIKETGITIS